MLVIMDARLWHGCIFETISPLRFVSCSRYYADMGNRTGAVPREVEWKVRKARLVLLISLTTCTKRGVVVDALALFGQLQTAVFGVM